MKQYKIRKFNSDCYVFEFTPNECRFDVSIGTQGKLEKLSAIKGEPKANEKVIAKMNACFFNMDGSSEYIGTYVDNGLYYNLSTPMYPVAVFWKKDNRLTVEHNPTQYRHAEYQRDAHWAIGCPWLLVLNGKADYKYTRKELIDKFGHPYQRAPRTMFGQKADGTIVWVVVDGRSKTNAGITITEQSSIMLELNCKIAFNADGGGSSEMIYDGKILNKPSDGTERRIGTCFLAYKPITVNETRGFVNSPSLGFLRVRDQGSTKGKVLGQLSHGDIVNILGRDSATGWYRIIFKNYSVAYVSDDYIKLV